MANWILSDSVQSPGPGRQIKDEIHIDWHFTQTLFQN